MKFSILIPTWNNFPFLKLCIRSIQENSSFDHQVLVHLNESDPLIREYLEKSGIEFTESPVNIGICKALNRIYEKATCDYIVYMNDDMYCLPGWDHPLMEEIKGLNTSSFMLSSTMIEPVHTKNEAVIVADFGKEIETFDENALLAQYPSFVHPDWSGSSWPPNIVHRSMWEKLGGYNEAFSPGMSSDDDFSMRMWLAGCRIFKGVSKSRVYHFQCKSTGRIVKNDGRKQFLDLYGMSSNTFNTFFLRKGKPFRGVLRPPSTFNISWQVKRFLSSLAG